VGCGPGPLGTLPAFPLGRSGALQRILRAKSWDHGTESFGPVASPQRRKARCNIVSLARNLQTHPDTPGQPSQIL